MKFNQFQLAKRADARYRSAQITYRSWLADSRNTDLEHGVEYQHSLLNRLTAAITQASPQNFSLLPESYSNRFAEFLKKCDKDWCAYIAMLDKNGFDASCRFSQLAFKQNIYNTLILETPQYARGFFVRVGWDLDEVIQSLDDPNNGSVDYNFLKEEELTNAT